MKNLLEFQFGTDGDSEDKAPDGAVPQKRPQTATSVDLAEDFDRDAESTDVDAEQDEAPPDIGDEGDIEATGAEEAEEEDDAESADDEPEDDEGDADTRFEDGDATDDETGVEGADESATDQADADDSGEGESEISADESSEDDAAAEDIPLEPHVVLQVYDDWMVVRLRDENGRPVGNARVAVTMASGESQDFVLDGDGSLRIEGIEPSGCSITFTDYDGSSWVKA